jgi:glutamate-1-semialdehyde 2,1-aminomutase
MASPTFGNRYLEPDSRSAELYARAQAVMPGGNTRTTVFAPPYPAYAAKAHGATVTDVDGQTRLDFVSNYTALIHGHAHPRIVESVSRQLMNGTAVSFPTEMEVRLAELLTGRVDSIERIRFTNSGTEAVMMAVQAARAFSGRHKIARFEGCYHGSYEFGDVELPFNDADTLERVINAHSAELAAVIVDPLPHRPGFLDPKDGFLQKLREVTRAQDVLLISDEIISFRLGFHGPQRSFGYTPDLTTLGKIIGGGFPVGAFGGRADVMSVFDPNTTTAKRVTHGGTFNANPVTMVAGYAAMAMMTPEAYDRLASLGQRVRTGLADLIEARGASWQISGQGSLFKLHAHPRPLVDYRSTAPTPDELATIEQFYMVMFGEGVMLTPDLAGCVSTPMTEQHVDTLIAAADTAFNVLENRA